VVLCSDWSLPTRTISLLYLFAYLSYIPVLMSSGVYCAEHVRQTFPLDVDTFSVQSTLPVLSSYVLALSLLPPRGSSDAMRLSVRLSVCSTPVVCCAFFALLLTNVLGSRV